MTDSGNDRKNCLCWIPVIATMLILLSMLDFGFAVSMGSLADELMELKEQVASQTTEMRVAGAFRSLSGGLVNLGDSQIGKAVTAVVDQMPSLWVMAMLAWGRVAIALVGFVLGWCLARRAAFAPKAIFIWSIVSFVWGLLTLVETRILFFALITDEVYIAAVIVVLLALSMHIFWPVFVGIRIRVGMRSGDFARR